MKWIIAVSAIVMLLAAALVGPAAAAQPENPTARAEEGSFNKSQTGLDHQSQWAWYYDGPAEPHVEWD